VAVQEVRLSHKSASRQLHKFPWKWKC